MTTTTLRLPPRIARLPQLRQIVRGGIAARGSIGAGLAAKAGGSAAVPYTTKILNLFGSALVGYYPLTESSGTVMVDASGNGRNGTFSGSYTLGTAGIGDGGTSVEFGSSGVGNIAQEPRVGSPWDIFAEGTLFSWMQVIDPAVWNDSGMHSVGIVFSDWSASMAHKVGVSNGGNAIRYLLGPANHIEYSVAGTPTNWHHIGVTWSQSSNIAKLYWDGVTVGNNIWSSLSGTWVLSMVGYLFIGRLAHVAFLNRAATSAEMLTAATL